MCSLNLRFWPYKIPNRWDFIRTVHKGLYRLQKREFGSITPIYAFEKMTMNLLTTCLLVTSLCVDLVTAIFRNHSISSAPDDNIRGAALWGITSTFSSQPKKHQKISQIIKRKADVLPSDANQGGILCCS